VRLSRRLWEVSSRLKVVAENRFSEYTLQKVHSSAKCMYGPRAKPRAQPDPEAFNSPAGNARRVERQLFDEPQPDAQLADPSRTPPTKPVGQAPGAPTKRID
jgi:hypothetical protein